MHLAITGLSYGTINNELSALVVFGKLWGSPTDLRSDFGVKWTLQSLRRYLGDKILQRDELLPEDLRKIYKFVQKSDFYQWSTWVGLLFLYRTLLRKGHLFPSRFNRNLLSRADITFTSYGILIKVQNSKTIQFQERLVEIPICRGGGLFCIVTLLERFFLEFPTLPTAPVLSSVNNGNLQMVDYPQALKLLKMWGKMAALTKTLGLHSLRRGAATLMALGGFSLEDIKNKGDWKSDAVLRYLSYPLHRKLDIEKKISLLLT